METKFQTSFIPKRPISATPGSLAPQVPRRGAHVEGSLFMGVAIVVFVLGILSVGGAYGWKAYLQSSQINHQKDLTAKQNLFKPDQIAVIRAQSTKISLAQQLLKNHKTTSNIFSVISRLTSESVRFLNMELTVPVGTNGPFQLTLSGYGRNYPSVAFQSDVLNQLDKYGLRAIVKNAIVSDPTLNQNGTVSFGFSAQIDPTTFSYSKNFDAVTQTAAAVQATSTNQ